MTHCRRRHEPAIEGDLTPSNHNPIEVRHFCLADGDTQVTRRCVQKWGSMRPLTVIRPRTRAAELRRFVFNYLGQNGTQMRAVREMIGRLLPGTP
jgi:hypothetical protein